MKPTPSITADPDPGPGDAVFAPGALATVPVGCATCDAGKVDAVFGMDPNGFVLCRECGAPLFYCDVGGQG